MVINMKVQKNIYDMSDRELRIYKRRLRKQREFRRKCMIFLMSVCMIIVCSISYHAIQSSANTGSEKLNFKYYTSITVESGDTLWDIADKYIDYNEYRDKNEYIKEVRSINHLSYNCDIQYGQILIVPYYSTQFVK